MARKKQKQYIDDNYNPFAPQEEIDHTKKLFFTWIFMVAGAVIGLVWGIKTSSIATNILFATVIGIALGSALDSRFPRENEDSGKQEEKK